MANTILKIGKHSKLEPYFLMKINTKYVLTSKTIKTKLTVLTPSSGIHFRAFTEECLVKVGHKTHTAIKTWVRVTYSRSLC